MRQYAATRRLLKKVCSVPRRWEAGDNLAARKLKEPLGGSWTIENTKTETEALLRKSGAV
jgi:hypothetical protein